MFLIGNLPIGANEKPVIIAELSGNHNQSLSRAMGLVEAAADAGVPLIKLQTYTADTLTLDVPDGDFLITDGKSPWAGKSLHELYREAYTPWEWHEPIMQRAKELGMQCISTPFDESAVDFLENLNVPAYKIASFENAHIPLIKKVAATGKPIIISTGLATISELSETIQTIKGCGVTDLILLKCTSSYPATADNSNILTIPHMSQLFNCDVGLSDHTLGIGVALAAIAHGAVLIEKHFTLRRSDGGVDAKFSMEPHELKLLVQESERAWQSLGSISYGPTDAELGSLKFRRSLYISKDMKQGDKLSTENMRIVRPGYGLEPKYYTLLLNKKVNRDVKMGTAIDWSLIV